MPRKAGPGAGRRKAVKKAAKKPARSKAWSGGHATPRYAGHSSMEPLPGPLRMIGQQLHEDPEAHHRKGGRVKPQAKKGYKKPAGPHTARRKKQSRRKK